MTEEQLKENIAKSIASLRKSRGMTQADLAQALNYSDKSVSKWERGDGVPDIIVIHRIAELFGVTLNDIINEESEKPEKTAEIPEKKRRRRRKPHFTNRVIIPLLSVGLVFLVFSLIFAFLKIFEFDFPKTWLVFILAIPVACIPLIVFAEIWWDLPQRFICITALVWSIVLFLGLAFDSAKIVPVIVTAAIFQVLVVLWFTMRSLSKKRRRRRAAVSHESEQKTNGE